MIVLKYILYGLFVEIIKCYKFYECCLLNYWNCKYFMVDERFEEWKGSCGFDVCSGCFYYDWGFGWFVCIWRIFICFN